MFGFRSSRKNLPKQKISAAALAGSSTSARRTYTLELTPAVVVAASIATVVVLAWVFVFGIIIGRGYAPLASDRQETVVVPDLQTKTVPPPPADSGVIKPEELQFMRELKEVDGPPSTLAAKPKPAAPATPSTASRGGNTTKSAASASTKNVKDGNPVAASKPALAYVPTVSNGGTADRSKSVVTRDGVKPAEPTRKKDPVPDRSQLRATAATYPVAPKHQNLWVHVFQVASYNSMDSAEKLCARFTNEGLRARVSSARSADGIMRYRVQTIVRGTEADAAALRSDLSRLGFKTTFLVSKKSVLTE